jgi:hypothetical protein
MIRAVRGLGSLLATAMAACAGQTPGGDGGLGGPADAGPSDGAPADSGARDGIGDAPSPDAGPAGTKPRRRAAT